MAISAEDVRNAMFGHASRLKQGYDMDEVDDFLDQVALTLDEVQAAPSFTPAPDNNSRELAEMRYRVRELEGQLARSAAAAPAHNGAAPATNGSTPFESRVVAELRRELDESRREAAQLREAPKRAPAPISTDAVDLLSKAQASADQTIAEADRYAQELVTNARRQFEEILTNARAAAMRSGLGLEQARTSNEPAAPPPQEPSPDIDYLRSCAEQAQQQLDSLLASLTPEATLTARDSTALTN